MSSLFTKLKNTPRNYQYLIGEKIHCHGQLNPKAGDAPGSSSSEIVTAGSSGCHGRHHSLFGEGDSCPLTRNKSQTLQWVYGSLCWLLGHRRSWCKKTVLGFFSPKWAIGFGRGLSQSHPPPRPDPSPPSSTFPTLSPPPKVMPLPSQASSSRQHGFLPGAHAQHRYSLLSRHNKCALWHVYDTKHWLYASTTSSESFRIGPKGIFFRITDFTLSNSS